MFIRWNRRKRTKAGWRKKEGDYLSAVLVESCRIDGKPRQKSIKHLGSIGEERLNNVYDRRLFWEKAEKSMDSLPLSPDIKLKLTASLERVVSKPTEEDIIKDHEEGLRQLKEIEERIAGRSAYK